MLLSDEKKPILRALSRELADFLADVLVEDLKGEILKRLPFGPLVKTGYQDATLQSQNGKSPADAPDHGTPIRSTAPRTLWTLKDLALDSGTKVSTWRRWILERRVPVVRIGRSVRIKDEDYRKLIQKGYRKAIIKGAHSLGG